MSRIISEWHLDFADSGWCTGQFSARGTSTALATHKTTWFVQGARKRLKSG